MMTYTRLPIAVLAAAGLAFGGALAGPVATPAAHAQQAGDFSDDKLQSFAEAAVKLTQIRSEYQSQMQTMETDQERQQLQQQTNQRMAQAVEGTQGISIEEYNEIAQASRGNQQLAQKINTYMKEAAN
jgi:alkanesulfonate monooxygenase SsuD/methylene tetrahydromethanopterin reductase-like flavin-dependent oxidoreductase (luciferase family)